MHCCCAVFLNKHLIVRVVAVSLSVFVFCETSSCDSRGVGAEVFPLHPFFFFVTPPRVAVSRSFENTRRRHAD